MAEGPGSIRPTHLVESFGPGSIVRTERDSVLIMGLDSWEQSEFGYEVIHNRFMEKILDKGRMRMPVSGTCTVPCRPFPEWITCSDPACGALQRRAGRIPGADPIPCGTCGSRTHPARFVVTCSQGHLDEFPWAEWAHRGRVCDAPSLREVAHGGREGLAGYAIRCKCGASRTYAGATSLGSLTELGIKCSGRSPWLDDARQECIIKPGIRGISVLASSLYVPQQLTAIHIPGSDAKADDRDLDDIFSEEDIKRLEYAYMRSFEGGDENLEIASSPVEPDIVGWVPVLKTVRRLTEIRALYEFARNGGEPCVLSKRADWCPATINKGEGIFFSLDESKLGKWAESPAVISRCRMLKSEEVDDEHEVDPAYAMLHTLAHALIRELTAVAGYSEASIRERIYGNGVLLYTASAQSEGGLGGLARQAEQERFGRLMRGALLRSATCSRDPLCADNDPVMLRGRGARAMRNASACYACMLLPETSCEARNEILDRKLLADEKVGFFAGMPDETTRPDSTRGRNPLPAPSGANLVPNH